MKKIISITVGTILCVLHMQAYGSNSPQYFTKDPKGTVIGEEYEHPRGNLYAYEKICIQSEHFNDGDNRLYKCTNTARGRILSSCDGEWRFCKDYSYTPAWDGGEIVNVTYREW